MTEEKKQQFKALALKKWSILDNFNRKNPEITSLSFSGNLWKAEIWIDKERDNIVYYEYRNKRTGARICKDYFPV